MVDVVLVLVRMDPIDGPGGNLANAGACAFRSSSGLPVIERGTLDADDLARETAAINLELHEIGSEGFAGTWESRSGRVAASGHHCASREPAK